MSDSASLPARPSLTRLTEVALGLLLLLFGAMSFDFVREVLSVQPAGVDFAPLWAGGRAALHAPGRLYDFGFVTALQGWPMGPGHLRPFAYPPSALLVIAPFALLPYGAAYALWLAASGGLLLAAGRKAGAPWWFVLLPWVTFCALCGQVTFLLAALILGGLVEAERRPISAGLLLGLAGAVKPQLLVLLPVALLAEGRWRTLAAAALASGLMALTSLGIWGPGAWRAWLEALPRFQALVFASPSLVRNSVTPYAALTLHGLPGAWALALAPLAALWVWLAFRSRADIAERLISLVGGALLITPYAMNYEMALFAPVSALYLARTADWRWLAYAAAGYLQSRGHGQGVMTLIPALALPFLRRIPTPRFFKS